MDDHELLSAWREGDATAGEQLFTRHFDTLCRYFRNKLPDAVDDLTQKTLLRCVKYQDKLAAASSVRAYLLAIARRELYRELEQRRVRNARFNPIEHSVEDLGPNVSSVFARQSQSQQLLAALRTLPLANQEVLELYFWEELTASQVAEIVDAPQGTVRTRIRRGLELLQQQLGPDVESTFRRARATEAET